MPDILLYVLGVIAALILGIKIGKWGKVKQKPVGELRIYTDEGQRYMFLEMYSEHDDISQMKKVTLNVDYKK
jgi:hypothetical protein